MRELVRAVVLCSSSVQTQPCSTQCRVQCRMMMGGDSLLFFTGGLLDCLLSNNTTMMSQLSQFSFTSADANVLAEGKKH